MFEAKIKAIRQYVSAAGLQEIDYEIAKYPQDERQSAVMGALRIMQKEHGYLTREIMDAVAVYLVMAPMAVYEVATFYSMYEHKPVGRHLINVCTNISCKLCDASAIIGHLETHLNIKLGETTADGRFTLRAVECLGACVNAPMMQIDTDYHENLTLATINQILEQYT